VEGEPRLRFLDYLPEEILGKGVAIVGCGSVGSQIAVLLAKLGFSRLSLYDPDKVEINNLGTHLHFSALHLGMPKVKALSAILNEVGTSSTLRIWSTHAEFPGYYSFDQLLVLSLDSLEARREIVDNLISEGVRVPIVDPRMALTIWKVYAVPASKIPIYRKLAFEGEGMEEPCTRRSVIHNASSLAATSVALILRLLGGEERVLEVGFDMENLYFYTRELG